MTNSEDKKNEEVMLKNVEFYSAGVTAWYNSSFELDKSILNLSAGGIALLVTLLTTVGTHTTESVILYIFSILFFLISLSSILAVFYRNKRHIEQVFQGNTESDPFLSVLDTVAVFSFAIGVLLATIIGISTSISSQKSKETTMAEGKNVQNSSEIAASSVNQVSKLINQNPNQVIKESVNNVGALQPQAASPTQDRNTTQASKPATNIENKK